uniref:Uncharacterized protein n=1 Tax=Heterorhabditis bacteriophora TaxID=37862 RepID=A0A1I7W6L1_HETBA
MIDLFDTFSFFYCSSNLALHSFLSTSLCEPYSSSKTVCFLLDINIFSVLNF